MRNLKTFLICVICTTARKLTPSLAWRDIFSCWFSLNTFAQHWTHQWNNYNRCVQSVAFFRTQINLDSWMCKLHKMYDGQVPRHNCWGKAVKGLTRSCFYSFSECEQADTQTVFSFTHVGDTFLYTQHATWHQAILLPVPVFFLTKLYSWTSCLYLHR